MNLAIFGATGSVGTSTLDVVARHAGRYRVIALTAHQSADALLCTVTALAQGPLPAGITHVTTVEGISEYRLDNGLQVLLFRDPSKATITST